jgi:hypothetical protein
MNAPLRSWTGRAAAAATAVGVFTSVGSSGF